MTPNTVILIPEKTDPEFEQIFECWTTQGGEIKRLGKYWIKDETIANQPIAIYGNQTFALVLAQVYDVDLISCDDKLIATLDQAWTKRNLTVKTVSTVTENDFPVFIKPVIPKIFTASVFYDLESFKEVIQGLETSTEVLLSTIITSIKAEARGYIKQGKIKDLALYEGNAELTSGVTFLENFAKINQQLLPEVVVVDIAFTEDLGWFILEFNSCWGAGLNNCKADKVIDCIIDATKNNGKV